MKLEPLTAYNCKLAAAIDRKWTDINNNAHPFLITLDELECEFWNILIRRLL